MAAIGNEYLTPFLSGHLASIISRIARLCSECQLGNDESASHLIRMATLTYNAPLFKHSPARSRSVTCRASPNAAACSNCSASDAGGTDLSSLALSHRSPAAPAVCRTTQLGPCVTAGSSSDRAKRGLATFDCHARANDSTDRGDSGAYRPSVRLRLHRSPEPYSPPAARTLRPAPDAKFPKTTQSPGTWAGSNCSV